MRHSTRISRTGSRTGISVSTRTRTVQSGFTLIELMVTLAVAAILVTNGIPAFSSLIQNNRATSQANELLTSLQLARSEAVKRADSVTVCASGDGEKCSKDTDWATGWIVFDDPNGNGVRDDGEPLIRVSPALEGRATLTGSAPLSGNASYVQFSRVGYLEAGATTITHELPGCTGDQQRNVSIGSSGHVEVDRASCS